MYIYKEGKNKGPHMSNAMHRHTPLPQASYLICQGRTVLFSNHLYGLHTPKRVYIVPAANQSSKNYITLVASLLLLSKLARRAQPRHRTRAATSSVLPGTEGVWEQLLEHVEERTPLSRAHVRHLHKTGAGREQLIGAPAPGLMLTSFATVVCFTHFTLWDTCMVGFRFPNETKPLHGRG